MSSNDDYITKKQLDEGLAKVTEDIADVINVMMERFDERFNKLEQRVDTLEDKLNRLTDTIDGFVKRLEDYEVESRVRDAQFERLIVWAKEVSEKTGIPMPSL